MASTEVGGSGRRDCRNRSDNYRRWHRGRKNLIDQKPIQSNISVGTVAGAAVGGAVGSKVGAAVGKWAGGGIGAWRNPGTVARWAGATEGAITGATEYLGHQVEDAVVGEIRPLFNSTSDGSRAVSESVASSSSVAAGTQNMGAVTAIAPDSPYTGRPAGSVNKANGVRVTFPPDNES